MRLCGCVSSTECDCVCVSLSTFLNCMYFDAENCAILENWKLCLCDDITNDILNRPYRCKRRLNSSSFTVKPRYHLAKKGRWPISEKREFEWNRMESLAVCSIRLCVCGKLCQWVSNQSKQNIHTHTHTRRICTACGVQAHTHVVCMWMCGCASKNNNNRTLQRREKKNIFQNNSPDVIRHVRTIQIHINKTLSFHLTSMLSFFNLSDFRQTASFILFESIPISVGFPYFRHAYLVFHCAPFPCSLFRFLFNLSLYLSISFHIFLFEFFCKFIETTKENISSVLNKPLDESI